MKFDNHPPINFDQATQIARTSRDGGSYSGIGYDTYTVYRGKAIHLVHSFSSGCEYNNHVDRTRTHHGPWATLPDFIAWLADQGPSWWTNDLMSDLGYDGAPA